MPATKRRRRTQDERSQTTRTKLLRATVRCLYERGYARTSTPEVAALAGLSRGAQLHHFPTKRELVTTAVEWLLEQRLAEFDRAAAALPSESDRLEAIVQLLWEAVSGPAFYSWLELAVAARTDPPLRVACAEISRRFSAQVTATFRALLGVPADAPPTPLDDTPVFAMMFLEGLAMDQMIHEDEARTRAMLATLRALGRRTLGLPRAKD